MSALVSTLRLFTRLGVFGLAVAVSGGVAAAEHWVGAWATAVVAEPAAKENLPLAGATLRQVVRLSLGGEAVRLRFSNAFGEAPLTLHGAAVALAADGGGVQPGTSRPVRFGGRVAVEIPPGTSVLSDPVELSLAPAADLAISLHLDRVPNTLTVHPGSRANSYLQAGDALTADVLPEARKTVHWFFLSAVDVVAPQPAAAALVLLGDSITDGYGVQPDTNQRWGDHLVARLLARRNAAPVGVLNLGIGGNRLLRHGAGQSVLARFDRDVLAQAGARWLLVFAGINDIGTARDARKQGEPFATAEDIIFALEQIAARARAVGLRVFGATITPYEGADFYFSAEGEADRQKVNAWIRSSGRFDAVVDFDAALRDPQQPSRLAPEFDCGDHLHPSLAGYRRLAEAMDLRLLVP
jgi:lysophospholipase L1-like esterase